MSRSDRIKEALGLLKVLFVSLVAIDVSLIAWIADNLDTAPTLRVVFAVVAAGAVSAGIIGANYSAYKRIAELANL